MPGEKTFLDIPFDVLSDIFLKANLEDPPSLISPKINGYYQSRPLLKWPLRFQHFFPKSKLPEGENTEDFWKNAFVTIHHNWALRTQ